MVTDEMVAGPTRWSATQRERSSARVRDSGREAGPLVGDTDPPLYPAPATTPAARLDTSGPRHHRSSFGLSAGLISERVCPSPTAPSVFT